MTNGHAGSPRGESWRQAQGVEAVEGTVGAAVEAADAVVFTSKAGSWEVFHVRMGCGASPEEET